MKIQPIAVSLAFALVLLSAGAAQSLSGTNTVDSGDIKSGAVTNSDLGANAVTGTKVKNGALTGTDILDNSLTGADINENTLTIPGLGIPHDNAVTTEKIAPGGVTDEDVAPGSIKPDKLDFAMCVINVLSASSNPVISVRCTGNYFVTDMSVNRQSAGVYCVKFQGSFSGGTVTINGASTGFPIAYVSMGPSFGCPAGTEATVTTYLLTVGAAPGNVGGTLTDKAWQGFFF